MLITQTKASDGQTKLTISPSSNFLSNAKEKVLLEMSRNLKIAGFREGKAPLSLVEKQADPRVLADHFLETVINESYEQALKAKELKPISSPAIMVKKFVPFSEVEYEATVTLFSDVKLTDYKKLKLPKTEVKVDDKEINQVLENLRQRAAERQAVKRVSQLGDEVVIDFEGKDQAGKAVNGASGQDYPLILGSGSFIKGFEDNLLGLKTGDEKTFKLTFPKDYGVKALANRKVTFKTKLKQVHELKLPKLDEEFIAKISPFKTLNELKADIKKQLLSEKTQKLHQEQESQVVREIIAKSQIPAPEVLVERQINQLLNNERQNLLYRGQTLDDFLKAKGLTEEDYRQKILKPHAQERVKGGLALSVIAELEQIFVTPEEMENRLKLLKEQYKDPAMQTELDNPDNRQEIFSRLLTEKTLHKLLHYAIPDHHK